MLFAEGSTFTHAERVNAVPRLMAPALRNWEEPSNAEPCPITPVVDAGALPDNAGCCCALSANGSVVSFKCQTKSWFGQTEPLVVHAGGFVAFGFPQ